MVEEVWVQLDVDILRAHLKSLVARIAVSLAPLIRKALNMSGNLACPRLTWTLRLANRAPWELSPILPSHFHPHVVALLLVQ